MKNEFSYIYNKPFKSVDESEQKLSILNVKENEIELKVNDVEMFNTFDTWKSKSDEIIETKIFYGINSQYEPLTFFNASVTNSTFKAIPHSTISSNMYIIGRQATEPILHFNEAKTKIKEFSYYNEDLVNIFGASAISIKNNFTNNETIINAKKKTPEEICKITCDGYEIKIYLVYSYKEYGNLSGIRIEPATYLNIKFSKAVYLEEVLKINNRLDSVIHLFILSKKKNKVLDLIDNKKNKYTFYNLKYNNEDKKKSAFYLDENKDRIENFSKLLNLLMKVDNENSNGFFPFLNYDRSTRSQEILFLEHYRVLEYMNILSQKKKTKGKNPTFLLPLLKKYKVVKDRYFPNQTEEEVEEEIRSLRNYYSHYGYYIKELPVPTDENKTKYMKKIDYQWLYNVKSFVKIISYLELYSLADINVPIDKGMFHFR